MAQRASDDYGTYGSVPTTSAEGGGGTQTQWRSNPEEFGAGVGSGLEKLGATTQQVGNEATDFAIKQQGLINETAMTQADANFAIKAGEIKSKYTSLTGMAAYNAFPQYQLDMKSAFKEARNGLNSGAQRGFDGMALRTMSSHIVDGSSYATSQLKEANRDSYSSLANAQLSALLDPDTAMDKERSQYHIDSLRYAAEAQVDEDHPGLKPDPKTGNLTFDEDTPEGKALSAQTKQKVDSFLTQGYLNRYETLSKMSVLDAHNEYLQERDDMPRAAQVALDASFEPKLFNYHVQSGSGEAINQAVQQHADLLYNPPKAVNSGGVDGAISTVLKNEGGLSSDGHAIYGIDKEAHPAEFLEAKAITDSKGDAAGKEYATQFYKEQYWDKKGIENLPSNTQTIVMDGVVNHYPGFSDKLVQAAKDGASPEQLIDMRRAEYQRLATTNPEKYGANLVGWNNRLDSLEKDISEGAGKPTKSYATNPDGSPLSLADYYRTHSTDVLARGDAYAEQQMPGDLSLKRAVRQSLENAMQKTISNQSAQYTMDNKNVMRAINGEFTKGKTPETEAELRSIPGMSDLLDKVAVQDPKFSEVVPTILAKVAHRNDVTNSPNGYDAVIRTLEPHGSSNPNAISSQDHLDRLLGRSDGTGINMKDYNDAKPMLEADQEFKDSISKHMKEIVVANGNIDGKGQERALAWYNQTMNAKKQNDTAGDKKMTDAEFMASIGTPAGPPMPSPPSRMQQLENWASNIAKTKQSEIPTLTDKSQFDALPSGSIYMRNGQQYRKP